MLLAQKAEVHRDQQRRVPAKAHHLTDAMGPNVQVSPSRHFEKGLRQAGFAVERGRLLPFQKPNIMLLRGQADFFGRLKMAESLIAPASGQLAGNPGMGRLSNHNQALLVWPVQHQSTLTYK